MKPHKIEILKLITDNIFCGLILIDMNGKVVLFSKSAEKIFKLLKKDVIGRNLREIEGLRSLYDVVKEHGENTKSRHKIWTDNYFIIVNLTTLKSQNKPNCIMAVCHESCSKECIDQELFVTENLLREINIFLESSHDGIFITDNHGKVIRVNAAWERIYSTPRKEVLGVDVNELLKRGVLNKSAAMEVLKTGKTQTVICEANTGRKIMATGTPVFDKEGCITSVVVNVRDVTELEYLEKQLAEQQQLAEKYSQEIKEMRRLNMQLPDLVIHSKEMKKVMDIVLRVAEVDSNILITGESGVGKGMLVTTIHKLSQRREGPIISINCGAIPANLLESELFGYESGAFTGASPRGKMGLFELANGGTLFLDEIAEIPADLQVKLLRAIQDKEVIRVGGTAPKKIDVRIIAATNRDLKKMMEEGRFRSDLYYRLNVIGINVPPLRERKEDIVPLTLNFIERFNRKYNKNKTLAGETVSALIEYNWPGNIRELENLIERLVVLTRGDIIYPEELPDYFKEAPTPDHEIIVRGIVPLRSAMQSVERQLIMNAKKKYGSTRKIAEALGINQSTVVRKLSSIEHR